MPSSLANQAIATRELASQARRLAVTSFPEAAGRLLRYAKELEAQAVDFDRRAKDGG
jgi:hypothetical protein